MMFELAFPQFQKIVSKQSNELERYPIYYLKRHGIYELYFSDGHWQFKTYIEPPDIKNWYENEENFLNEVLSYGVPVIDYD